MPARTILIYFSFESAMRLRQIELDLIHQPPSSCQLYLTATTTHPAELKNRTGLEIIEKKNYKPFWAYEAMKNINLFYK